MHLDNTKYFARKLLSIDIVRRYITHFFLMACSYLLQLHLLAVLSMIYRSQRMWINFMVDVAASLVLHDIVGVISWAIVQRYREPIGRLLRPVFDRPKKRRALKTVAVTTGVGYAVGVVQLAGINELFLTLSLLHMLVCYLIREYLLTAVVRDWLRKKLILWTYAVRPNAHIEAPVAAESIVQNHFATDAKVDTEGFKVSNVSVPNMQKRMQNMVAYRFKKIKKKFWKAF